MGGNSFNSYDGSIPGIPQQSSISHAVERCHRVPRLSTLRGGAVTGSVKSDTLLTESRNNERNCEMDSAAAIAKISCALLLLQLAAYSGQSAAQEPLPADVVQKLYHEVVARHPLGVPYGAAKTAIWPLLSKRLIKVFETRNVCDQDWESKHRNVNPPLKAPGFYEDGLFSGSNERGEINGAEVGATKAQADGSYLVYVNVWSYFDGGDPSLRSGQKHRWRIAARVISEDGQFAIDDILGFKGVFDYDKSVYMSKMLTSGCKGSHSIVN
jgi:hypothetical protein